MCVCYQQLKEQLLGFPAIKALKLLSNVHAIDNSTTYLQYPSLFIGLGKSIQLS